METLHYELVVVGGGLAGMCAAIAAARHGTHTALIHNRPMPGGNASSEIRMHICGADGHMSRPHARETGILEEILLEHKRRNLGNSYAIFDSILWEKAALQQNLTLYLNTHVTDVNMTDVNICNGRITAVMAIGLTNERRYRFEAPLFMDATGDGSLGAAAGADYTVGREARDTYGEGHAPVKADHYTMGNSLMFRARDMGKPIPFVKPAWANTYTEEQLRRRDHGTIASGYWWIELGGGEQDTVADAEAIRDDLLKAVFGVWDHIKNHGGHGADNYDLEWVGFLPGKRESRRLLGDYVLNENDCRAGTRFPDAVAYGGWPMDVHTVEGFRNERDDPTTWLHLEDVYTIPYRCLYARNVDNLFLAGRIISCSHMAFASARVMATCAVTGQAAGVAAALAAREDLIPRQVGGRIEMIQQWLLRDDCYIPGVKNADPADLARTATVTASGYLADCVPENVINGTARTVGRDSNCWRSTADGMPWIALAFAAPLQVGELRLTFDSNLSREITISINDEVLARQSPGTPPELVRDYRIELIRNGQPLFCRTVENNTQRHNVLTLPKPITCDRVRVTVLATNGADTAGVYEIRAYGSETSPIGLI